MIWKCNTGILNAFGKSVRQHFQSNRTHMNTHLLTHTLPQAQYVIVKVNSGLKGGPKYSLNILQCDRLVSTFAAPFFKEWE